MLNYEIEATCDFGEAKRQGEPEYCICTLFESFMDWRSLFHYNVFLEGTGLNIGEDR